MTNRRGARGKISSYGVWADMLQRCSNPNLKNYPRYGGRGITVCASWKYFDNFYRDMGDKPKSHSLGRINNDGNYCKENCRWETNVQQNFNKISNKLITFNNETKPLTAWARLYGISPITLSTRLKRGWSVMEALTIPVFVNGGHR